LFRILWSIFFVFLTTYAYWIYINRDEKTLRENLESSDSARPRIELENFTIYRYQGSRLESKILARMGQFVEPNSAEFFGDFQAYKYFENDTQSVRSESALGIFDTESLGGILGGAELSQIELTNDVRLYYSAYSLFTDTATYLSDENVIFGEKPVQIVGSNRWFRGKNGFRLDLNSELVNLYGKVVGESKID